MKVDLYELVHLDLRVLVATLPERLPLSSCLEPDEWLWLVGMLATRTVAESADLRPEDWPACSRANLYAFRSAEIAGGIDHREYVMRRLNLTAALLDRVAPDREVEILSPEGAFALLLDNLPMSLEEAFRTAPRWRELEIDQIRRLRTLKNMLTPALAINALHNDARISAWEPILPMLP